MSLLYFVILGMALSYSFLAASTPMQRLYAAGVIRRAIELSREKQESIAREMNDMDPGQFTRSLQGAGRVDFALLMTCCPSFLRGLSQAIGEAAGADPQAERIADVVADRVAARLADIRPRMMHAALAVADKEVASCR